ncbi:hypothetical protein [Thermosulfurimonas sp. F29]|uniref:hypothetical protein n=1 Tax=Thermosulfurimonas sp. F29 TaxID=2867247 RepID=UPI001C82DB21|nr:hypothetical protein [Thermosulfurimonas sp. F29]MBX6424151.1 hypothetical protein [Thermosulfurimonas sp. F29]
MAKHTPRFYFTEPPFDPEIPATCLRAEILVWQAENGRDPIGERLERKEGVHIADITDVLKEAVTPDGHGGGAVLYHIDRARLTVLKPEARAEAEKRNPGENLFLVLPFRVLGEVQNVKEARIGSVHFTPEDFQALVELATKTPKFREAVIEGLRGALLEVFSAPVFEPPKRIKEEIFRAYDRAVTARGKLFSLVKEKLPEPLRENLKLVGPDRVALTEPVENESILRRTPFRLSKTDPWTLVVNRRTKTGKELAEKMSVLYEEGLFYPAFWLADYAESDRFGFLRFHLDEKRNTILYVGVFGVDEEKMERDGWRRWRMWVAPPASVVQGWSNSYEYWREI